MDYLDRIAYSKEQMLHSLESSLDQLNTFRYDTRFKSILGEPFIDKLNTWVSDIRKQKDNPYTVVVIGDFKRGKSTLINALLQEEVATTDVTTETVTLNKISYGVHGNEAILSGNRRIRLSDKELKREYIEQMIAQTGERIEQIHITRDNALLKKITILDTPGTGDAMQDFSDMVKESLLMADAVVYVYNAQYPLSLTEQLFLKSTVMSRKHTAMFLVGNFADTLGTRENYDRMRSLVSERINQLIPDAEILMVSALDELCRILGEERPNARLAPVLEEQFDRLRSLLDNSINERAENVVLDRMQRLTAAMVADLSEDLTAMEAGLSMDAAAVASSLEKLDQDKETSARMLGKVKEELHGLVQSMQEETNRWMGEFVHRLECETGRLKEFSYDDIARHFEFYCLDMLQEAMKTCVEFHQEIMYDHMEAISADLAGLYAEDMNNNRNFSFRVNLDSRVWTKADTAGFVFNYVAAMVPALQSISTLITDTIAGHFREKEVAKSADLLITRIAENLPKMNASVKNCVYKVYEEMDEKACKLVEDYFAKKMEDAQKRVEQSAAVARKQAQEKEEVRVLLTQAREILNEIQTIM